MLVGMNTSANAAAVAVASRRKEQSAAPYRDSPAFRIFAETGRSDSLVGRGAADGALWRPEFGARSVSARATRTIGVAAAHRVLQVGHIRIAMPRIASGETTNGRPAPGSAGGVYVARRQGRFVIRFDGLVPRSAAAAFIHFSLGSQRVLRSPRPARIEVRRGLPIGRLSTWRASPRIGKRIEAFFCNRFPTRFALAVGPVVDSLKCLADFAAQIFFVFQQGRIEVLEIFIRPHVAQVHGRIWRALRLIVRRFPRVSVP